MSRQNNPAKPLTEEDLTAADTEQDDAVIGEFFRRSIGVIAIAGVVIATLFWWLSKDPVREEVDEAVLSGPQKNTDISEPEPPAIVFSDVTQLAGIKFSHENGAYGDKLLPETMGGGVAVFDYDNDGLDDLFFVNSRTWPWAEDKKLTTHKLYRNTGSWKFEDVTEKTGLDSMAYGMGVAVGDYDNDGYNDLYITTVGHNELYKNIEGQRFEAVDAGVKGAAEDWSSSAAFFDMDNDGDLDLFVANYVKWSREIDFEVDYQLTGIGRAYGPPTNYEGTTSYLFRNEGGQFLDVSAAAGIQVKNSATGLPVGKGLAVKPLDLNADGLLDVIVANDTVQNFVFMNTGAGKFEESGALMGIAFDNSGSSTGAMGLDSARFNNDDDLAIAIANFANEMTSFYVARGTDIFTDESIVSGIGPDSRRALSFGLFFFDADLDGRLDLLAANGHVEDDINIVQPSQKHAQPVQLFWNCGSNCRRTFKRVADNNTGDLSVPVVGRGASFADFDLDGDLDVVITQTGGSPMLLRNEQKTTHNWVRLELRQSGNNVYAIGANVELQTGDRVQHRSVMPARSYLSQVPLALTFGLGNAEQISVSIRWPDGKTSKYNDLGINQTHRLER